MYKSGHCVQSPQKTCPRLAPVRTWQRHSPRAEGSADKAPHARSRRPAPPQPALPAPAQGGARRSTEWSRERKRGQSRAEPHPGGRTPARSRALSATDKTPKNSLPKNPPRPGSGQGRGRLSAAALRGDRAARAAFCCLRSGR